VKLRPEHVPLEIWIRELVDAFLMKTEKEKPEITLKVNLVKDSYLLDEVHMSTVLNNLLTNAVKYGHTPCQIEVEAHDQAEGLVIRVADNGPGIRRDELRHIFEKFYRGSESKERVIKGLGLGLYYVKQIVEAHHGTISVQSTINKGTQFMIQIPTENGLTAG
jgi:signal transduction histidine kinase